MGAMMEICAHLGLRALRSLRWGPRPELMFLAWLVRPPVMRPAPGARIVIPGVVGLAVDSGSWWEEVCASATKLPFVLAAWANTWAARWLARVMDCEDPGAGYSWDGKDVGTSAMAEAVACLP